MIRRLLTLAAVLLAAAWLAFGVSARRARAERLARAVALAPDEVRGAWHVHTTASDGRGTLDEVVEAAREAGLRFVVVTDHNVQVPERPEYRAGVLVIPATESSTRFGHVVGVGLPRALDRAERDHDPLGAMARLGGTAVLAHPLHPRRPFRGWGEAPWRGLEVMSNDTAWGRVLSEKEAGKLLAGVLLLPWDRARAVLALQDDPADELARFDAEARAARAAGEGRVLLCSADAHGYPSYVAAFEAFSMHVPVALSGDAAADAAAVSAALLDGRAACVADGLAPAARVALTRSGDGLSLALRAPPGGRVEARVLRDGEPAGALEPAPDGFRLRCAGACAPGDYRAEVRRDGRPWIFTNPVRIE